ASLLQHFKNAENLILESNRALQFLQPQVSLTVVDYDLAEVKPSARELLHRVHAIVARDSAQPLPGWIAHDLGGRPIFSVKPPQYVNDELLEFVRRRLDQAAR